MIEIFWVKTNSNVKIFIFRFNNIWITIFTKSHFI